jgi:ribonuclease HI
MDKYMREMYTEFAPWPDIIMMGDGSGTTSDYPCGYSTVIYFKSTDTSWLVWGGFSNGTNNFAELNAYLPALWNIDNMRIEMRLSHPPKILIISDSELTVKCGKNEYARTKNRSLWAVIEHFEKYGWQFNWHHINRLTRIPNKVSDLIANLARIQVGDKSAIEKTLKAFA